MTAIINADIFADRRRRFLNAIGSGAVAIMPSAPVSVRSGDVEFIYRQDNDFYYLTGFAEPESVALFAPDEKEQFILLARPRDKDRETWTGRRAGLEGAVADYGADKAFALDDAKLAAFAIAGSLNWIGHWYQSDGPLTPKAISEEFTARLTEGLAHGPDGGKPRVRSSR